MPDAATLVRFLAMTREPMVTFRPGPARAQYHDALMLLIDVLEFPDVMAFFVNAPPRKDIWKRIQQKGLEFSAGGG